MISPPRRADARKPVILGIDPGIGTTGYGALEGSTPYDLRFLGTGVIRTPIGRPDPERLGVLYEDIRTVLERYRPDFVAVEKVFFKKNITTAIQVAQARGVLLLAVGQRGLPVAEYSPVEIKASVGGWGKAGKPAIKLMVQRILKLPDLPSPDDAADALAIALTHAFRTRSV